MNFAQAEAYLYSLGNEVEAMKLGLENICTLLAEIGKPDERYLKVQVAGTNGKGSVCAFLDSICRTAGIRTGLYTSPHLVSITERIKIDGTVISEDYFARLATTVRTTSERLLAKGRIQCTPTYFEQVTAIGLLAFSEAKVELAILETGLGGRLDATTAANAEIAAITRIDLDHQEYLGDTLYQIASEKAAIIHSGSRAVVCRQSRPAMKAILKRCKEVGVKPRITTEFLGQGFGLPALGLRGMHQTENAEVAILLAYTLRDHFEISDEAITAGLENARHSGRLEYQGRYLFDGAHNISGARALAEFIRESEKRPITLVFGAMNDKNVTEMLALIAPLADLIVVTKPFGSRALAAEELKRSVPQGIEPTKIQVADTVEEAISRAHRITPPGSVILVTGSLYLVGEVKKLINN